VLLKHTKSDILKVFFRPDFGILEEREKKPPMIRGQNDSAESCRKSIRIENLITCAAFYSRKQIPVLEGFLSNHLTLVFVSDAEVHSISYTNKALVF